MTQKCDNCEKEIAKDQEVYVTAEKTYCKVCGPKNKNCSDCSRIIEAKEERFVDMKMEKHTCLKCFNKKQEKIKVPLVNEPEIMVLELKIILNRNLTRWGYVDKWGDWIEDENKKTPFRQIDSTHKTAKEDLIKSLNDSLEIYFEENMFECSRLNFPDPNDWNPEITYSLKEK